MGPHSTQHGPSQEKLVIGPRARPAFMGATIAAVLGLALALVLGYDKEGGLRRFYFAYLTAFGFFLSVALGALFFVLMQHLTRAGWSVVVRRLAESLAGLLPVLGILSIPILVSVGLQKGDLYRWALPLSSASPQALHAAQKGEALENEPEFDPAHPTLDSITLQKRAWLNPEFFVLRVIGYFAIWSAMAMWYRRLSLQQDEDGDPQATRKMQIYAGIATVVLGLTLTGAAGDLFMSLDPHWYSTMWAVYYFAGSTIAIFAGLIIFVRLLQGLGYLSRSVTVEHYHDLGKYLFGFTFFFGYIAFSQYMLLWYANIPEEIEWLSRHGATTVSANVSGWSYVIIAILFGQFLIPFAGLLSRHVKRRANLLLFWAVWALGFHLLDVYWIVMPECPNFRASSIVIDICAAVGMGGVLLASLLYLVAPRSLRPVADPRLAESLAFENA